MASLKTLKSKYKPNELKYRSSIKRSNINFLSPYYRNHHTYTILISQLRSKTKMRAKEQYIT